MEKEKEHKPHGGADRRTQDALAAYDMAADELAAVFLDKQYGEEDAPPMRVGDGDSYWAGGDTGGILCFGDGVFGMDDVLTDLRENAPAGEIQRWQAYDAECRSLGISTLNYHSWLRGASRHAEDTLRGLRKLRDRIARAKDDFARAVDEYNESGEGRP